MPNCIDNLGCLVVQAVPASPTTVAVPFRWTAVAYSLGTASLIGLSVEPELSPPIHRAGAILVVGNVRVKAQIEKLDARTDC
jgi:hypothetical protein